MVGLKGVFWELGCLFFKEISEPEVFFMLVQETEFLLKLFFDEMAFVAQQSGQDVILFRVKVLLVGNLIDDLEMEIGDQQVGRDMQEVPRIPHP